MTTEIHPNLRTGDDARSASEIEDDIRRTRGRMDATLDELSQRLSARSLLNSALDWWEERSAARPGLASAKAKGAGRAVARQVKDHPGPALLIGAGVAWLIMDAASDDEDDHAPTYRAAGASYTGYSDYSGSGLGSGAGYAGGATDYGYASGATAGSEAGDEAPGLGEKASAMAGQAQGAIAGAAAAARDKVSGLGSAARETVSGLGSAAQDQISGLRGAAHGAAQNLSHRAGDALQQGRAATRRVGQSFQSGYRSGVHQFQDAVEESPLAVGLGFAALGMLVGLLVPSTRGEDQLLGERSDHLMETVKEAGREAFERGKVVAQRVAETVTEEAQKQGLTGESAAGAVSNLTGQAGGALSEIAGKVGEVLQKAKEEAKTAAEEEKLVPEQLKSQIAGSTGSGSGSTGGSGSAGSSGSTGSGSTGSGSAGAGSTGSGSTGGSGSGAGSGYGTGSSSGYGS